MVLRNWLIIWFRSNLFLVSLKELEFFELIYWSTSDEVYKPAETPLVHDNSKGLKSMLSRVMLAGFFYQFGEGWRPKAELSVSREKTGRDEAEETYLIEVRTLLSDGLWRSSGMSWWSLETSSMIWSSLIPELSDCLDLDLLLDMMIYMWFLSSSSLSVVSLVTKRWWWIYYIYVCVYSFQFYIIYIYMEETEA